MRCKSWYRYKREKTQGHSRHFPDTHINTFVDYMENKNFSNTITSGRKYDAMKC